MVEFEYSGATNLEAYRVGRGQIILIDDYSSVEEAFSAIDESLGKSDGLFAGFQPIESGDGVDVHHITHFSKGISMV